MSLFKNEVTGRFKYWLILVMVVAAIWIMSSCFAIVPTGHTGVVTNFGRVTGALLEEGLHMKMPIVTEIIMINNQVQKVDAESQSASKDLQTITSVVSVNYRINRDTSAEIYRNVGRNVQDVILAPSVQECVKAVTSQFTAEELITKRQIVGMQIKQELEEKVKNFGITIEVFNIINFDFSEEFSRAIEEKQTAQQLALKAEQDLVRIKIEAEQQIEQARAEAEAYKLKSQEITDAMIRLEAIKKWNGQLPTYVTGDGDSIYSIPLR